MLRIWGRANSVNVQKVLWCCAELGVEFERIDAGMQFGVVDTPEYQAMNPNALIPTIDDDGFILWESNTIVRYLAKRHGEGSLFPGNLKAQCHAEQWMDWQATTLWPGFRDAFWQLVRVPEAERDIAAVDASLQATAKRLASLEARLQDSRFVVGDTLTIADIPLGPTLYRCFSFGIERGDFPNVARWYDALGERPAFCEIVMQPIT